MATSSKVMFNLSNLQAKAVEAIDLKIAMARLEVESAESTEAFEKRIKHWREDTINQIVGMADRLRGDGAEIGGEPVGDYALSKFRNKTLKPMPEHNRYELRDAERTLSRLEQKKIDITAKSASLVPDEKGNISLTVTQLSEFFGL